MATFWGNFGGESAFQFGNQFVFGIYRCHYLLSMVKKVGKCCVNVTQRKVVFRGNLVGAPPHEFVPNGYLFDGYTCACNTRLASGNARLDLDFVVKLKD